MQAATHSGKFHADDVLAWALLKHFLDQDCELIRTRDPEILNSSYIVFDVGGIYDPQKRRFDHHQKEYSGSLSSAGMVLNWLFNLNTMTESLYERLQKQIVNYVDDVDNGRRETIDGLPCFAKMVDSLNNGALSLADFDSQFTKAATIASFFIESIVQEEKSQQEARALVLEAMNIAEQQNKTLIELPRYLPWQSTYFANGGKEHPTEFILFPTLNGSWQVLAIPPQENSFAQKRSFPEEWAGLRDQELSDITGEASIFCHKNRFIAVFHTKDAALNAMKRFNLLSD